MSAHARLSPSAATRWMQCPGSVPLNEAIRDTSSKYAEEGTRAHELAAALLRGDEKLPAADNSEMEEYVRVYVDTIRREAQDKILLVEQRVSPKAVTLSGDNDGTADAVILDMANSTIEVHDLKFGKGHMVDAEENPQLMLYALGALCSYEYILEATRFKLVIHQVRRDHISEWYISREKLLEFGARVKGANIGVAQACVIGNDAKLLHSRSLLNPSDEACLWCRAKTTCPALNGVVQSIASSVTADDFEDVQESQLPTPGTLKLIKTWVSAVEDKIREKLDAGMKVPGWKLVKGRRGARKWIDESAAADVVRKLRIKVKDAFNQSLKTPTQLEKVVPEQKWEKLAAHVTPSEPGLTVVPETDKRPEAQPRTTDDFENLT